MRVKIWSLKHKAWWNPDGWGYTTDRHKAGVYDLEKATKICLNANTQRLFEEPPQEAIVPMTEVEIGMDLEQQASLEHEHNELMREKGEGIE